MTQERVRGMLSGYMRNKARKGHLEAEIKKMDREYQRTRSELVDTLAGPRAQVITDMPHGTGISDPTAQLAVKLAGGWENDELKEMRREIQRKQGCLEDIRTELEYVDAWVEGLPARERFVIEHQMLRQEYWREVEDGYRERFGYEVSRDTLKRTKMQALTLIYQIADATV